MDPISGLSGIMQALRQRLADRNEKGAASKAHDTAVDTSSRRSAKADISDLRRQIATRLNALQAEERTSPRAARIFVESALAWEFGDEILTDPEFAKLASDVQQAIDGSPETRERFAELLKGL
jgi:hypothetical protein